MATENEIRKGRTHLDLYDYRIVGEMRIRDQKRRIIDTEMRSVYLYGVDAEVESRVGKKPVEKPVVKPARIGRKHPSGLFDVDPDVSF